MQVTTLVSTVEKADRGLKYLQHMTGEQKSRK